MQQDVRKQPSKTKTETTNGLKPRRVSAIKALSFRPYPVTTRTKLFPPSNLWGTNLRQWNSHTHTRQQHGPRVSTSYPASIQKWWQFFAISSAIYLRVGWKQRKLPHGMATQQTGGWHLHANGFMTCAHGGEKKENMLFLTNFEAIFQSSTLCTNGFIQCKHGFLQISRSSTRKCWLLAIHVEHKMEHEDSADHRIQNFRWTPLKQTSLFWD